MFKKAWTKAEVELLTREHQQLSFSQLAEKLGRSPTAVRTHTLKLGLREKKHRYKRWSKAEMYELYALSERFNIPMIAEKMGRSVPSVKSKMIEEGIRPLSDCVSLKQFSRDTGYAVYQILRAKEALDLSWRKVPFRTHGQYAISADHCDKILEYLKNEKTEHPPVEVKFFAKVEKTESCWLWKGGKQFFDVHTGREYKPARKAWLIVKGPLRYEERLYRRCKTPSCCNPDHHWVGLVRGSKMSARERREALAHRGAAE